MSNILILGASSDIAVALAKKYAKPDNLLILAGRNVASLEEISSDLKIRHNAEVVPVSFDALDFQSHQKFYDELAQKPDIVICVFGYLGEQIEAQKDWDECHRIIDSNFTGAVSILNVVANDFERRGSGTIVGISSVAGDRGKLSNFIYGSAKSGFTTYLAGLRNRLFHAKVHVLTVKPGFVYTQMTEGMDLPKAMTASPNQVATQISSAIKSRKNTIYTLKRWRLVMFIINMVPEFIFKRLKM